MKSLIKNLKTKEKTHIIDSEKEVNNMSDFSEKLIELMKVKNVNQTILSNETGIKVGTISNWIKRNMTPRPDKIKILSEYFNVPTSYFFNNESVITNNIDKSLTNYQYAKLLKNAENLTNEQLTALNDLLDSFKG